MLLFLITVPLSFAYEDESAIHWDQLLHHYLMSDYDSSAKPNYGQTNITMNFDLYGITEVNTIDSYVVLKLSMNMWWHDD